MIRRKMDYLLPDENFGKVMEEAVWPLLDSLCEEMMLEAEDGAPIHGRLYRQPESDSVVCISHGFTEYADKYGEVIYMFLKAGFSVAICEHRGHGFSARELENLSKVHIDNYDTYISDYHCFVERVREELPDHKRFLFGHSMGGCIAALYIETYPEDFASCILSSPMLEVDSKGIPKLGAYIFGRTMIRHHHGEDYLGSQDQDYSGDETFEESCCNNFDRWNYWHTWRMQDTYLQSSTGTISWMTASLEACHRAVRDADKIQIPVLLLQAGRDSLVLPGGQMKFIRHAKGGKLRIFEESKHEIYNATLAIREPYWKSVIAFFGLSGARDD